MSAHDLQHVVDVLGRTLLHFLWQGLVIALVLEAWLAATRQRPSGERYLARCAGLLLLCAAPAWTFALLWLRGPVGPDPIVEAVTTSAVAAQVTETAQELGTLPLLVALWAVGVALFSLRLVGGCAELLRLRRRLVGAPLVPEWQARFDDVARRFGVHVEALVVDSAVVAIPTVIGYLKPVVLLPGRLFTGLTQDQLEALIAHELAHVARHDTLVNLAQSVVESLFFYHPAVWWISRGLRTEREFCCDDRAVVATQDGLSYARALAALEAWRGPQPQLGVSTLGGSLMQRIQRLVGPKPGSTAGASPRHAIATLTALGALGATAFGFASWTAPAAAHDCECSCHGVTQKPGAVRWQVREGGDEGRVEVLGTTSGTSSGGGAAKPERFVLRTGGGGFAVAPSEGDYERVVVGQGFGDGEFGLEFVGGGAVELHGHAGQDADARRLDVAALERQLAELKKELGDLAQQREALAQVHGGAEHRYLIDGKELHEHLGDLHHTPNGEHDVYAIKPTPGGGRVLYTTGDGELHDVEVTDVYEGRSNVVFETRVPGGTYTLKGVVGDDGQVNVDVEELRGHLAETKGQSRYFLGSGGGQTLRGFRYRDHGDHDEHEVHEGHRLHVGGGGGNVFHVDGTKGGNVFHVDGTHEGNVFHVGGSGQGSVFRVGGADDAGADVLFRYEGDAGGNVFFHEGDEDGNVFFHDGDAGGQGRVLFSDSDGDGLPDGRVTHEYLHTTQGGASGGGDAERRVLRLREHVGGDVVVEEIQGGEANGELLFDDHGVRVRRLDGGVLTVEAGQGLGEHVVLELRTNFDEETGKLELEQVLQRVEGASEGASEDSPKRRMKRHERHEHNERRR